jgi:hypothetical protein
MLSVSLKILKVPNGRTLEVLVASLEALRKLTVN